MWEELVLLGLQGSLTWWNCGLLVGLCQWVLGFQGCNWGAVVL